MRKVPQQELLNAFVNHGPKNGVNGCKWWPKAVNFLQLETIFASFEDRKGGKREMRQDQRGNFWLSLHSA